VDTISVPGMLRGRRPVLLLEELRRPEALMHVVVHVKDLSGQRDPACAWEDYESRTQLEAADRAWKICNGFFGNLSSWELEARSFFEAAAPGLSIGPGDFVEVDGVRWTCRPVGFERS
jgi:hypothetical protein